MLEIEIPITARKAKHSMNEVGIAKPTSSAERTPSEASTTIITSAIAVSTEPSSCWTMERTVRDWSLEVVTSTASRSWGGQRATSAATSSRTSWAVSMRLKPLRLTIWSATVGSPSKRAVPSRSSNVRRMSARSPSVTTRSPLILTGSESMSRGSSKAPSILTALAPVGRSIAPAATSWLLFCTTWSSSAAVTL